MKKIILSENIMSFKTIPTLRVPIKINSTGQSL